MQVDPSPGRLGAPRGRRGKTHGAASGASWGHIGRPRGVLGPSWAQRVFPSLLDGLAAEQGTRFLCAKSVRCTLVVCRVYGDPR